MRAFAAIAALACAPSFAEPAPGTGVAHVRAAIDSGCRISGQEHALTVLDLGALAFGTVPSIFTAPITAQSQGGPGGTIELRCNGVESVDVSIGPGLRSINGQRRLGSGTAHVPYGLYADSAFNEPFLISSPRSMLVSPGGGSASASFVIFGRILPHPGGFTPGAYSDVVEVTIAW